MNRTVLWPHCSRMRPLWYARVMSVSQSVFAGAREAASVMSSMPIIRPLPRISPISAWRVASSRSRAKKYSPTVRALPTYSCSTRSSVASAAAQQIGLPP